MSFDVDIGYASDRGPRESNEDFGGAVRAAPGDGVRGLVAAVADGVSSGGLGIEAAQTTVMGLLADWFAAPPTWEATVVFDRLIGAQNTWLANHNRRRQGTHSAALTTLTALALEGQTWTLAHVGDTRAWLLRLAADGATELSLLTQDHAFDGSDMRSRLTRAIGLDDAVRVDYAQGDAHVGDVFVLTTDGVHGSVGTRRLAELATNPSAQAAADALVAAARERGSKDNASALVLRVTGLDTRALGDEMADGRRLATPPPLKTGDVLDGYTITARIASNGVHVIYQARDATTRDLVAIKALHPSRGSDRDEREMLAHEAWLGQRLADEDGFVRLHGRRAGASAFYIVFDWHQGRTLEQRIAAGERPTVAEFIDAALPCARALGRLHRLGIVHRDIKPGNLHQGDDGRWRILDLGAASSGREGRTLHARHALHAGTPSYMNPEQWQGKAADAGSDLFALGVTLYQWLTGTLPYGEIEPYQTGRYRHDPKGASRLRPDVPIWLDHVLAKAVARDPARRFETAEEMLLTIERGAARPLTPLPATPLIRRDPLTLWRVAFVVSLLFNLLLVVWVLFLPR
jgi:serine/threonine protein phosphatase PrpC